MGRAEFIDATRRHRKGKHARSLADAEMDENHPLQVLLVQRNLLPASELALANALTARLCFCSNDLTGGPHW